jgi:hypothetical protein
VGTPRIEAVVTVKNSSGYRLRLSEVSILTPYTRSMQGKSSTPATPGTPVTSSLYSCHCAPAVPYDGSEVDSTIVTIPPDMKYVKTTASYSSPDLETDGSVDVPGCEPMPEESLVLADC